jgi:hypothetical protein
MVTKNISMPTNTAIVDGAREGSVSSEKITMEDRIST